MGLHERWVLTAGADVPEGAVDAGTAPSAARVEDLAAAGGVVLVTLESDETEPDPALLAAASVYAWLGARAFRVPGPQADAVRQVVDMVASIQGVRPPAATRRGLA
ncbi:hypothetical protein [Actinomadura terrae]|uniref:hypothetical protein n=1 Tax=Actinomadura terrae TaxID=604353 RepID=UPI001FA74C92|nr:hypothetical protein [Actinomadura terrae]